MYASLLICGLLAGWRRRIRLPLLLAIAFLTVAGAATETNRGTIIF
jgi:hypothetical protein